MFSVFYLPSCWHFSSVANVITLQSVNETLVWILASFQTTWACSIPLQIHELQLDLSNYPALCANNFTNFNLFLLVT